ncbi:nuclear transport factor 2 family protein [Nocardioides sp. YIM 152315]|uniref:nuclear transport factor 2 family protein n=1 Tax=Nocardioides sp. YIM 152315 TaxID=3031760 RepID=UPI0023DA696C|nr:nuclear transport factor 2 family protein [Nocardioides sp. YIM 152315]MDF1604667.1 nuclear transport factor 2 family protein [Nocardioides sp. YIM 152315]
MEQTLEERVARLEAIEEIRRLKHRYLRACDLKEPETFRDCFVARGASIDYGPRVGRFEDADGIAEVYRRIALEKVDGHYNVLDMHHALQADIDVVSTTEATGQWTLRFRQVDRRAGTERVSAIEYDDRYEIEDGSWRIRSCHVRVLWAIVKPLPEGHEIVETLS